MICYCPGQVVIFAYRGIGGWEGFISGFGSVQALEDLASFTQDKPFCFVH